MITLDLSISPLPNVGIQLTWLIKIQIILHGNAGIEGKWFLMYDETIYYKTCTI
jgi:hypothetical protein